MMSTMVNRAAKRLVPTRRSVLGAGFAGGAAAVLAACESEKRSSPTGTRSATTATAGSTGSVQPQVDFDPQDWESVRAQFPLDPELAQFAAFVLSPHTRVLDAAIAGYRDALGRDTEQALQDGFGREDDVRRAAMDFAGGRPAQYALTDSTTMGIATMYGGLDLSAGDEVLTTTHDFYSTEESLRLLADRTGAQVRRVTLYDDPSTASVDQIVARLVGGITARTRVVALTWVHSSTGVRLPLREIVDALERLDKVPRDQYLVCADGVHGFAAVDVDLPDLGCDFLAAGTHKWLFGPRGTGILWARDWDPLTELIPTFSRPVGGARLTAGGYHDFEHRWALADAFAMRTQIGRGRAVERTVEQASRLKDGLAGLDGITVVTPTSPELSAGIVCVDVRGMLPANAVAELRTRGIVASATPYRVSYLRLGPSIATTPEQVDAAVTAISELV
jgi:selenocysteine lyase/cysteine desulfurase